MDDPFGRDQRRAIAWAEHEALFHDQQARSLIGDYPSSLPPAVIDQRIAELTALEADRGFVFVGERAWLETFRSENTFPRYDQWIDRAFRQLGVEWRWQTYSENPAFPQHVWAAEIASEKLPTGLVPLPATCAIEDQLDLFFYGTEAAPSPSHLVRLFEFLSSCEAMVAQAIGESDSLTQVFVTGFEVTNPGCDMAWSVLLQSEYGAEWDRPLWNRRVPSRACPPLPGLLPTSQIG